MTPRFPPRAACECKLSGRSLKATRQCAVHGDRALADIAHGPRVVIFGRRVHHGLVGAVLGAAGAVLAWHDRKDFPWSLHDGS